MATQMIDERRIVQERWDALTSRPQRSAGEDGLSPVPSPTLTAIHDAIEELVDGLEAEIEERLLGWAAAIRIARSRGG